MAAYYNEIEPKAAAWLRELIKQGRIADGVVDERSIEDVLPNDLAGFTQCHFFAGIGGWSHALRLAGWPDDKPVWTGSCPCQPFSAAGKRAGFADERHLWPAFLHLIQQCRPAIVFGEQSASPDALHWVDLVQTDLEASNYAFGAADIAAAGIGAPHVRQRLYWVANTNGERRDPPGSSRAVTEDAKQRSTPGWLGNSDRAGLERREILCERHHKLFAWPAELVDCSDGYRRPFEPGSFPLANGLPAHVERLRGYGNAIVPQVAAAFIEAAT